MSVCESRINFVNRQAFSSPSSSSFVMMDGLVVSNNPPDEVLAVQHKVLDPSLHSELSNSLRGTLHPRGDSSFNLYSKLFNGDVIPRASLLVRPFDAEDVSQVILFCKRHSLSLSVKAGGYGTHGQAVQGDIIVDVSLIDDINIETGDSQGGFTSLKDMPSSRHTGKGREVASSSLTPESVSAYALSSQTAKRRADEAFGADYSANQHLSFDPSNISQHVAGSDLSAFQRGATARRRIWPPADISASPDSGSPIIALPSAPSPAGGNSSELSRQDSSKSFSGKESASGSGSSSESVLSRPSQGTESGNTAATSKGESDSDPFGYMVDSDSATTHVVSSFPVADPLSATSQSYLRPGLSSSSSMDLLSSAGHYMPTRINPLFPHACVTFGAGAKQKDVDLYSASHPVPATSVSGTPCYAPYHVPFSAHPVGSSVMLLGGFGFLSRLHGLSMDNLVEVEMVLADGKIVIVNETEHPDLWWALRGAGPAFGIVTRYKAKAYPVPVVFAGNLLYKFRKSTAASLIKHFRDCVKNVPRELYANVILTAGPDGDALVVIQICYLGSQEQGVEFLQAITSWDGEQCLLNEVWEKSFLNQQDSLAQLIRGKAGRKWFIRSDLLNTLSDDTIHETVMRFADTPVGCTWLFELSGGNVSDEHGGCFPASSRQATWTVAAFHQWELDEDDPRCVSVAEDWIKETLSPASSGGPFPSFFAIHESGERIKGSFGDSWPRLCELKRKYDPAGFFKHNFWPLDENDQPKTTLVPTHTEF